MNGKHIEIDDSRCCFECDEKCVNAGHDVLPFAICNKSEIVDRIEFVKEMNNNPGCKTCRHRYNQRSFPCSKCSRINQKHSSNKNSDEIDTSTRSVDKIFSTLENKELILYKLARVVRNTDALHPSIKGPLLGKLLLELRLLDGTMYDSLVIEKDPNFSEWF